MRVKIRHEDADRVGECVRLCIPWWKAIEQAPGIKQDVAEEAEETIFAVQTPEPVCGFSAVLAAPGCACM